MRLKPCPFCGGDAEATQAFACHWVFCKVCEAQGPTLVHDGGSDTKAIAAWNRRPKPPSPRKRKERT